MIRLGSWNVNGIRARLLTLTAWLLQETIDIALIQETKVKDELFPEDTFKKLGYHCCFFGQPRYNGVAILSKYPPESIQYASFLGQCRYIEATVRDLRVASVYVPNGQTLGSVAFQEKMRFFSFLKGQVGDGRMANGDFQDSLLGGDWNIAPRSEDVHPSWDSAMLCSPGERKVLREFCANQWQQVPLDSPGYTWWQYQDRCFSKNIGLRIDFFLASAGIWNRIQRCYVQRSWRDPHAIHATPSDHAPVILELS